MAAKITTLYVGLDFLRLLVTEGDHIKSWAEIPLEPGTIENAVVIDQEEFVSKVKRLLESQQVKTKKILVGISGLRCLTRPVVLPQLPDNILDEAVRREAERALPVPLEQLHLSWQVTDGPPDKTQVFVVGMPRETGDSLLKALSSAGLKPTFMGAKPILLSRLVSDDMAVIIDVQPTEFDIVVLVDGIPQPVRTILLPTESDDWDEKLSIIASETNRTITFYNSNNPERPMKDDDPVYISGDMAHEPELCQLLSEKMGSEVVPLGTDLNCPEAFIPNNYLTNIGLVLHKLDPKRKRNKSAIDLNILPAAYLPKPISLINVTAIPAIVILIGILAAMFVLNQNISGDIAALHTQQTSEMMALQQKQIEKQTLDKNIADIDTSITKVQTSMKNFTDGYDALQKQRNSINGDLQTTLYDLPNGVTLSTIAHITSVLTVTGTARTDKLLLDYITQLSQSGRFVDVTTTSITRNSDNGTDFTLLTLLKPQAIGASSLDIAIGTAPGTITLTKVNSAPDALTIDGVSPDGATVVAYMDTLEASQQFNSITLISMSRMEDGNMQFELVLQGKD